MVLRNIHYQMEDFGQSILLQLKREVRRTVHVGSHCLLVVVLDGTREVWILDEKIGDL